MTNWPALIGAHFLVQQRIGALDQKGLWRHELPCLRATGADVDRLEGRFGQLPAQFRGFLLAANGWRAFYQWVDLLGVDELLGPEREKAVQLVPLHLGHFRDAKYLAVAATREGEVDLGPDLFLLTLEGPTTGQVNWIGNGALVDTFSDFEQFFVSMTAYERMEEESLIKEQM